MKWMDIWWWKYLFSPKNRYSSWWNTILCRMKGHPEGIIYYNVDGLEPDYRCKNCGDDVA